MNQILIDNQTLITVKNVYGFEQTIGGKIFQDVIIDYFTNLPFSDVNFAGYISNR